VFRVSGIDDIAKREYKLKGNYKRSESDFE
jgi:hypothetical protein